MYVQSQSYKNIFLYAYCIDRRQNCTNKNDTHPILLSSSSSSSSDVSILPLPHFVVEFDVVVVVVIVSADDSP